MEESKEEKREESKEESAEEQKEANVKPVETSARQEPKGYVVDGYLFVMKSEAQAAQKELQGVRYLQKNNNLKDIKVVQQVYYKLLEQGIFHTPVGLNFLKSLQNQLNHKGVSEELPPIPVPRKTKEEQDVAALKKNMLQLTDVGNVYKTRFRRAMIVIVILAAAMVFMVGVAATTNQPNILNYEEKIIDKYETWQNDLEEREQKLNEVENK